MTEDWQDWDYDQLCHCERCLLVDEFITKLKRKDTMNANQSEAFKAAHETLGVIELVDENGNPTGEYINAGIGEATSEETAYLTKKHPDHAVTIH